MFEHFCGDWAYAEPTFCCKVSVVLLDGILDDSKFQLFEVKKNCILIWFFLILFEKYSMLWLSIRRNDLIACRDFISHWVSTKKIFAHAQPAFKFWQFITWTSKRVLSQRRNNFIAYWSYEETVSSLAEHTRKRFQRRRNFFHKKRVELHDGLSISSIRRC